MSTASSSFHSHPNPLNSEPEPLMETLQPTAQRRVSNSSSTDMSDFIDDLSFEYIMNENGELIRLSRSPKTHASPPTSTEEPPEPPAPTTAQQQPPLRINKPPTQQVQGSSSLDSVLKPQSPRTSLSRSESAYPVLNGHVAAEEHEPERPARSFHRVASVPSVPHSAVPPLAISAAHKRAAPRRVMLDEQPEAVRQKHVDDPRLLKAPLLTDHLYPDDKENIARSTIGAHYSELEDGHGSQQPTNNGYASSIHALASRSMAGSRVGQAARSNHAAASASAAMARSASDDQRLRQHLIPNGSVLNMATSRSGRVLKASRVPAGQVSDASADEQEHRESAYSDDENNFEEHPSNTDVPPPRVQLASSRPAQQLYRSHTANDALASSRNRRSASLSEHLGDDESAHVGGHDAGHYHRAHFPQPPVPARSMSRPGTSLGVTRDTTGNGPRRVTVEERERQEMELRAEQHGYAEPLQRRHSQTRQSPSPTHNAASHQPVRPSYAQHRRRESDTLRSSAPYPQQTGSPTVSEAPTRVSPTAKGLVSSHSQPSNGMTKHARSPTAPEVSTTSNALYPSGSHLSGKTLVNGDDDAPSSAERERRGSDLDRPMHKERPRSQNLQEQQRQRQSSDTAQGNAQSAQSASSQVAEKDKLQPRSHLVVNRKPYARLDLLGKGGSSRVFRVMNAANELYAIKRVSLDKTDPETMSGYMNEIALLKRLEGNSRIIRLIDSEVRAGPNGAKGYLLLVMECGEIDLSRLLNERAGEGLDMVWIAYYWQQMLQAVQVIHEEKIVHSDLKPANFVLVKGQLKLIDFGIANAIANDTTNIQREHTVGTVNYMAPEAIELPEGMRRLKVGRPSDVWSLGIILYQMVYGSPPFQHLSVYQKMKAIPDGSYTIDFPEYSAPSSSPTKRTPPSRKDMKKWRVRGDVMMSMQSCLRRVPKERMTIPELLDMDWLAMRDPPSMPSPSQTPSPNARDLLGPDEVIINPHYMCQLLQYGLRLAQENTELSYEALLKEGQRLVTELQNLS